MQTEDKREIAITRREVIPGSVEAVFEFIAAEDVLPKVLTGYGPLPAVVNTSDHTASWDQPGAARVIHLADGSSVREQVTDHRAPDYFAYRVWDFGNPIIRTLARGARGEWTFSAAGNSTQVIWTYRFYAKNRLAALPLAGIVHLLWRGYMDVCLKNSRRIMAASAQQPAPQHAASATRFPSCPTRST
ncbi:MAG: SRPBCC family protein [Gammaproteobacteria bacterium]|nr:SRPBCC family protein [Gammaproteobacteria bacterium]